MELFDLLEALFHALRTNQGTWARSRVHVYFIQVPDAYDGDGGGRTHTALTCSWPLGRIGGS